MVDQGGGRGLSLLQSFRLALNHLESAPFPNSRLGRGSFVTVVSLLQSSAASYHMDAFNQFANSVV